MVQEDSVTIQYCLHTKYNLMYILILSTVNNLFSKFLFC
jgi:hypothetical protein